MMRRAVMKSGQRGHVYQAVSMVPAIVVERRRVVGGITITINIIVVVVVKIIIMMVKIMNI